MKRIEFKFDENSLTEAKEYKEINLSSGKTIIIPKNECEHLNVTVYWRLYSHETLYDPAEYTGKAHCNDCGEWMEPEDVPDEAEREDVDQ